MCGLLSYSKLMLSPLLLVLTWPDAQVCLAQQASTEKTQAESVPALANSVFTPKDPLPKETSSADLVIGNGDLLQVGVFGSTDFDHQVRVGSTGDVSLPLIGSVQVSGMTPEKAQRLIHDKLVERDFYRDPQVSVFVKEYASGGAYVLGEVQKPGFYPLLNVRRLFEALSIAGGTTPKAGRTVTITNPNHPQRAFTVTLSNELKKSAQENLEIMPGDTIMVSKADIVYVVGDVRLPTGVAMENGGLTILQAIAMAQGTNSTAALDRAKLIRRTATGPQEIPFSLKKILAAQAEDLKLQADDIIFIPGSATKNAAKRGLEAMLQVATGIAIYRHP